MFKCCLCGKEYEREQDAIKCVNKCGRQAFADGKFVKKEVPQLPDVNKVEFIEVPVSDIYLSDILTLINKMIDAGAPLGQIAALKEKIIANWNEIDNNERSNRYNRVLLSAWLYGIKS